MFKTIQDIQQVRRDFWNRTRGIFPNVLYCLNANKMDFVEMFLRSEYGWNTPFMSDYDDITVLGMKVRFSDTMEGVDYLKEIASKNHWEDYAISFIRNNDIKEVLPTKPKQKKKRKIIL